MITPARLKPRFNTTVVQAPGLDALNVIGWRVIASRLTTSDTWVYTEGVAGQTGVLKRLRDLGAVIMTQRRDGDHFTLLAKVSNPFALAWGNLIQRELDKLQSRERVA